MKPKSRLKLRELNKTLTHGKIDEYLLILRKLCSIHSDLPEATEISVCASNRDFAALVRLGDSLSKQKHLDARLHFLASQFAAILRKYPHSKLPGINPQENAEIKYWQAEHKCRRVNSRFRLFSSQRSPYEESLASMRSHLQYHLGTAPDFSQVVQECGFGPGASLGVHGNATNSARKILSESWTVTPSAYDYGFAAVTDHAQLVRLLLEKRMFVDSSSPTVEREVVCYDRLTAKTNYVARTKVVHNNKIVFVPKTALVHRTIAVEPLINGYLQKGVDILLRRKLKRIGIDLSDQSLNQKMAHRGSLDDSDNGFVTIDLSSASDSIATEVVRNLLPPDWFAFLNAIRSKHFLMNGKIFPYHKFCSMGNGFCFPLETLIFTSACLTAKCGIPGVDFSVYGDDIIVRKKHAADVLDLLHILGFSVNKEKTFIYGPFRESCGADWFGGEDVRPFTLDFELDSLSSLFKFLNLTTRNLRTSRFFEGIRDHVRSLIPRDFLYLRPYPGNADSAVTTSMDDFLSSPFAQWNRTHWCWRWREMIPDAYEDRLVGHKEYHTVLWYGALAGVPSNKPFTLRRKTKTKVRHVSHSGATSLWLPSAA